MTDLLLDAGVAEPGELRCLPDLVEALVLVGRLEDAEARVQTLETWAQTLRRASAGAAAARCRGVVAAARSDGAAALAAHARAVALSEDVTLPFERGRALLALGTEQRRARQRRAARESLEAARAIFDSLGAERWSASAAGELARIGGRSPGRTDELTGTERRVAELVAAGRTNREVASELVVSVHTVEAALTSIYRKLDVRSRTEMARRLNV
jgi:DNA-binding CsgD family transcriptional regulator